MGFARTAAQNLIGLIFPNRCLICEAPLDPARRQPLCLRHEREIEQVEPPVCGKCGRKMFGESVEQLSCERCRSPSTYYDAGYSACIYAGPVRELVHLFKYRGRRYLQTFLGGLIVDFLRGSPYISQHDAIVPVPLHWWRYCTRGFNQAADLAKPISRHFHVPIMKRNLRRIRHTSPQVRLPPKERSINIKNAFKVSRPSKVAGKRLVLLDDIITSGATLNECARVLKEAGASGVTIITLAHPSDVASREDEVSILVGAPQI